MAIQGQESVFVKFNSLITLSIKIKDVLEFVSNGLSSIVIFTSISIKLRIHLHCSANIFEFLPNEKISTLQFDN
jgi:hypothetical protein